jgi:hypothetical protein
MPVLKLDFRAGMSLMVRHQDGPEHKFEITNVERSHITMFHEGDIAVHDEHGSVLPCGEIRIPLTSRIELDVNGDVAIFNFRSSASVRAEISMDALHTYQFQRIQ